MGRRPKRRVIGHLPQIRLFLPEPDAGHAAGEAPLTLGFDEVEALRLAHMEGLEQALAARALGISRPTFGRILQRAHEKVARALVEGRPMLIEGGSVTLDDGPSMCTGCARVVPADTLEDLVGRTCPRCGAATRTLLEEEVDRLSAAQLVLLGEQLDLRGKRAHLRRALQLGRPHAATNTSSRLPARVDNA